MEKTAQSVKTRHQRNTVRDDFDFDGRQVRVVLPAALADEHTKGHRQLALVLALVGFGVTGEEIAEGARPWCRVRGAAWHR
jgi:hypothetical protein